MNRRTREEHLSCKVFAGGMKIYKNMSVKLQLMLLWTGQQGGIFYYQAKNLKYHTLESKPTESSITMVKFSCTTTLRELGFILDSVLSFKKHCVNL